MYSEPNFKVCLFNKNGSKKKNKTKVWRKLFFIQIGYKKKTRNAENCMLLHNI